MVDGRRGTLRPVKGKVCWHDRMEPRRADTRIDEPLSVGRGQPVGPMLAASSDGGGIAADPPAARPVQVTPVPASLLVSTRCPPALPRWLLILKRGSAQYAGWL